MRPRLCFYREEPVRAISTKINLISFLIGVCSFAYVPTASAGSAPQWMHALVDSPLPSHDEKTEVVLLYSERNVTLLSPEKIKILVRKAYKVLRPEGHSYGTVAIPHGTDEKISNLRGWCIPVQGKDYEVKDNDNLDISLPNVDGSELIDDVKERILSIPAADPGNIVGYEYEEEKTPLVLQDIWYFQDTSPVRESRYSVQIPEGWEYKASWLNGPEVQAVQTSKNQFQWILTDIKAISQEPDMPPLDGVTGKMIISFRAPGGA